jgi:hypothetical protein
VYYPAPKPAPSAAASPLLATVSQSRPAGERIFSADQLLAGKPSPGNGYAIESDENVLRVVRLLLARSPDRAVAWAGQASDPVWRDILVSLVFRTWAEEEPSAAFAYVQSEAPAPSEADLEAVLLGAASHPDVALPIGLALLASQPDHAGDFGAVLLGAFVRAGQFSAAIAFANAASDDLRDEWLATTFKSWSQQQPEQAAQALATVTDPALYEQLFQSLTAGWASANPSELASYALTLPPGDDRSYALGQVFDQWSLQDPAGLATWLFNHQTTLQEFDSAVAAIIQRTDQANRDTLTALQWAESINDPELRFGSVNRVVKEWAVSAPSDALNYVNNAPWLDQQQRIEMLRNSNLVP